MALTCTGKSTELQTNPKQGTLMFVISIEIFFPLGSLENGGTFTLSPFLTFLTELS